MDPMSLLCGDVPSCAPLTRVAQLLATLLLGVLFTQSGLDKILDWQGNLGWITEHFAQTPFRSFVKPLLATITVFEVCTGLACLLGAAVLLLFHQPVVAVVGVILSGLTMLQLFAGQRIAKDYDGAAQIAPYFLVMLAALALFSSDALL